MIGEYQQTPLPGNVLLTRDPDCSEEEKEHPEDRFRNGIDQKTKHVVIVARIIYL